MMTDKVQFYRVEHTANEPTIDMNIINVCQRTTCDTKRLIVVDQQTLQAFNTRMIELYGMDFSHELDKVQIICCEQEPYKAWVYWPNNRAHSEIHAAENGRPLSAHKYFRMNLLRAMFGH